MRRSGSTTRSGPGRTSSRTGILVTARELNSQFEWAAHEPEALGQGISAEIFEVIKHRRDTSGLDEADVIVIELARAIFGARTVPSETFARSLQQFGRRKLVDLIALMGNYASTAALLRRLRHATRQGCGRRKAALFRILLKQIRS